MTLKVVINSCYGIFKLSEQAFELLKKAKLEKGQDITTIVKVPRHDKDLVQIVEKLGSKAASGDCAKLKVEKLHQPIYRIENYDGKETVVYPEDQKWCFCPED